jgi:hypothetical protein
MVPLRLSDSANLFAQIVRQVKTICAESKYRGGEVYLRHHIEGEVEDQKLIFREPPTGDKRPKKRLNIYALESVVQDIFDIGKLWGINNQKLFGVIVANILDHGEQLIQHRQRGGELIIKHSEQSTVISVVLV